ncbi:MAG: SurA N-terminal domain-containing protein [Flavobacteriales bacterium]|nr:SurA N-terminal domain-containing protein [Flavobacteriales bacterium]
MAIIGKIRERSFLVLIIIGVAILAFVLTDLFSAKAGGQQGPISLAEIDGHQISPQEFDARVRKAYDNYQKQTQQELDERTKSSIRESVWAEITSDILVGNEMEELGINVTSKELFDLVQGSNPHPQVRQAFSDPNTGEFNSTAVVQFLQNLDENQETKTQWLDFEKALKRNHRMDKYNVLIKKGIYTPSALATVQYNDNNTSLAFKYIYKPYTTISDSTVSVTESEIKSLYEKTKSDYDQKASRKIAYAYFPVIPSALDQAAAKSWVDEIYAKFQNNENDSTFVNANSDQRFNPNFYSRVNAPIGIDTSLWSHDSGYVAQPEMSGNLWTLNKVRRSKMGPDSVKARHILFGFQARAKEVAEKTADSVLALLNSGIPMDSLVSLSDDKTSAESGGDLGWFAEGTMVKPFNDAAFIAEIGAFTKVESQFGYHLIEVTEKLDDVMKIQIATITRAVVPSKNTYAELFNKANSFSINVTNMESFRSELTAGNVQQRTAILNENENTIQGLDASKDLARWSMEASEGDVSEAKDVDNAFVVAIVESVDEDGPAPLEKVRNRVEFLAKQNKKAEMMMKELSGASDIGTLAGNTGLSVQNASVTFSSPSISSVGLEPKVVGKAMNLVAGQISDPIQGATGVFVVVVDKKVDAGQADINVIRESEFRGMSARIDNGAVYNALKEKAEMIDNRSKFY